MPYEVNADLPPSVRSHLPEHAQDIFREASIMPTPLTRMIPVRRKPHSVSPGRQ
jgi:cation transport regulator ChaB